MQRSVHRTPNASQRYHGRPHGVNETLNHHSRLCQRTHPSTTCRDSILSQSQGPPAPAPRAREPQVHVQGLRSSVVIPTLLCERPIHLHLVICFDTNEGHAHGWIKQRTSPGSRRAYYRGGFRHRAGHSGAVCGRLMWPTPPYFWPRTNPVFTPEVFCTRTAVC